MNQLDFHDELAPDEDDLLETVEFIVASDDRFTVDRGEDGDVQFAFEGACGPAAGYLSWREELPALLMTVGFNLNAAPERRTEAMRLAALVNEHLWLGHFDVWSDDGAIMFRHSLPMIGRNGVEPGEVMALMAAALDAADRFHPAFAFLLGGDLSAEAAAEMALFETAGQA